MACPLCDDTGWKPVDENGVRRVVRCECWREQVGQRAPRGREHPEALPALHARQLLRLQRVARARGGAGATRRARPFRSSTEGLFLEGQPGVGKTHLAVAVLKQVIADDRRARPLLRHARPAARHPQHLRPVDPHDRARGAAPGDDGGPARARRPRRREDLRVGRRDDESHRQHALQRAAPDDLHVELPGHPGRHRAELAAVPDRRTACGRACTRCASSWRWTAPTTASCPTNGGVDDLVTLWKTRRKTLPSPRGGRQARAQLREPAVRDGKADLKWPGGRAGS